MGGAAWGARWGETSWGGGPHTHCKSPSPPATSSVWGGGARLMWSTRWGDTQGCTTGRMQKQRLSTKHAWPDPTQPHRLDTGFPSPSQSPGPGIRVRPSNCHLILSQFRSPLPLIPIMSAERMPRTLHRSTMSGWMCLARPGGAVRVGAETHRRAGFCVGLVNLCPVTTAHKEGYVPLNLCPFTSAQTNLTGTNHLTGLCHLKKRKWSNLCAFECKGLKQAGPSYPDYPQSKMEK